MASNVLLQADFNQRNVRNGVIEMLASNLKDDSDKDTAKSSLKESLALIQKGNKVPYGPANHLLICILRSLRLVDDLDVDETFQGISQDKDNTIDGPTMDPSDVGPQDDNRSASTSDASPPTPADNRPKEKTTQTASANQKKKEVCRYYTRGHCTKKKIAGSTTPQSARSSITMEVSRLIQKDAMANATHFTLMSAGALLKTKLAAGMNVGSTT